MKVLVSACLLGINCKYNGENNYNIDVINFVKRHQYLPICPEQMAGLTTPRDAIEILNGRVVTKNGVDVTSKMDKACDELVKYIELFKPDLAILKSRSPSCGYKAIYDGSFTHTITIGNGKAADIIFNKGIEIITEEEINLKD